MLSKLLIAWSLMALCVMIHAMGMMVLLRWVSRLVPRMEASFWYSTWALVRMAGWIIFLHLLEIAVWAFFYSWKQAMPDLESAVYFSAVTYTTTGYGDLVLSGHWRMVGGVEALTGILMCGLSGAFMFAVINRMYQMRSGSDPSLPSSPSQATPPL